MTEEKVLESVNESVENIEDVVAEVTETQLGTGTKALLAAGGIALAYIAGKYIIIPVGKKCVEGAKKLYIKIREHQQNDSEPVIVRTVED